MPSLDRVRKLCTNEKLESEMKVAASPPQKEATPSFLWKEGPRRGGGWMGKAVSPTQSLPRMGKVASGASRIGF